MELLPLVRKLWRRRLLLVAGGVVAIALALAVGSSPASSSALAWTSVALDTFNEPHLMVPTVGADVTVSFPREACFVLGASRDSAVASEDVGATV